MKILFVIHDNKKGGASISFLEMVSQVRKQHEVFVITPHKTGFLPEQLDQMGIRHRAAHYYAWLVWRPENRIFRAAFRFIYYVANKVNVLEAGRIAYLLSKEKFDLIHTNSSVVNFGGWLSEKMHIPHVWHVREMREGINLMPVMNEKKMGVFIKEHSDCIVAISKAVGEKVREWTEAENIRVIYNGVSEEYDVKKDSYPQSGSIINFLISGNICKEKGQEDVVRAAKELCKQSIYNFHVYIAGNGNKEVLEQMIEKMDLQEYVTILGGVKDMRELRSRMNVEIMASKLEGFGRVTIEAMRASNPVIGTNAGGTAELITEGRNGLLYPYGEFTLLSEKMKEMIQSPELIARMGNQAYQDTHGKFTPEENAASILAIYRELKRE